MESSLKESWNNWIEDIRKDVTNIDFSTPFKWWEFVVLIFGCYIKEIIEFFLSTFKGPDNGLTNLFSANAFPFSVDIFWILVFKLTIGLAILGYFYAKHKENYDLWNVVIFWLFAIGNPLTYHLAVSKILPQALAAFLQLSVYAICVGFFLFGEKFNLDLLKVLIYEGLEFDIERQKFYSTPWTKFSGWKLFMLFLKICIATSIVMVCYAVITQLFQFIIRSVYGSKEGETKVPKNQEKIKDLIKSGAVARIFFTSVIIAPIIEEQVMRQCLMKIGNFKKWTIPCSGFIFALIHLSKESVVFLIPYIIPGIMFGLIYYLTKNIWYVVLSHSLFNICALINSLVAK